jgi:hypothetical protein
MRRCLNEIAPPRQLNSFDAFRFCPNETSMKLSHLLLLLFLLLLYSSPGKAQDPARPDKERRVTVVYDSKTDTTVVRFGPMHLINFSSLQGEVGNLDEEGELRVSGFFTYKGKDFLKPQSIGLIFLSFNLYSNRWDISKRKDLEFTADNNRYNIANVELIQSSRSTEDVIDQLGASMPCETFAKIVNAKKVKLRLGDKALDLTKQHLTTLRDLAGRAGC